MLGRNATMRWLIVLLLLSAPVLAQDREVDIELVLAVDVSRSISPYELEIQRRGYAEALASPEVVAAITGGLIGEIALTYVEWAGSGSQTVIVPWTLISDAEDAQDVASRLTAFFGAGMRRTSISEALLFAADRFEGNGFRGLRRIIDISGDGPNNQGRRVLEARSEVLGRGIVINGLPLMTVDEISQIWGIPDLDLYYRDCVIGGAGAFVVPVLTWDQFPDAVKRKLVLEIAGTSRNVPGGQRVAAYDCEIGEKIWERNRRQFFLP